MSTEYNKIPPHDFEAEKALLCCILTDEDYTSKLRDIDLRSEYFYAKQNRFVYEAIIKLETESANVDLISLKNQLVRMSKLSECGGLPYLTEIMNTVSTSANILHYAEIVENKFLLRSLIGTATGSIEMAYQETEEAKYILDKTTSELFILAEKKNKNFPELIDKPIMHAFQQIESWSKSGVISGVTSGYPELDAMTAGWQKNAMVVLAARPSMGKTQLALNFAVNAASKDKVPVAIFSLEMGKTELAMRLMSMEGEVSLQKLKKGDLFDDEWTKLGLAMGRLSQLPIYIDDSSSLNVLDLRTKSRRLKKEHDIGMIIVDYIGLMDVEKNIDRHEGISRISRALKGLAKELEIPVMVLSQLNREVDKRPDKRPLLSDLRESGAIEQDADMIIFILRPEVYNIKDENGNSQEGRAEVIIGKQRSGPTGSVDLFFDKKSLRFKSGYDKNIGKVYNV